MAKKSIRRLDQHAQAIGSLCIMFNAMEARVNSLIGVLSRMEKTDLQCFTNQLDLLKKLPILKALAFRKRPSQLWFDDIDLMVWAITERIMPRRNRYVHDTWLSFPDGAVRRHQRTAFQKAQSRQEVELSMEADFPTTAEEILEHVQATKDVANILRLLEAAFTSGRAATIPEKAFPQPHRDKWRALRKPPQESSLEESQGLPRTLQGGRKPSSAQRRARFQK